MQIGIVGLGRMGANMARRLARSGVDVLCHDQADAAREAMVGEPRVECAANLPAMCGRLEGERVILVMLPAGDAVEDTIRELLPLVATNDLIVDGGNSYYRDSKRRVDLVIAQDVNARARQAARHVGAHAAESDYSDLHARLLNKCRDSRV